MTTLIWVAVAALYAVGVAGGYRLGRMVRRVHKFQEVGEDKIAARFAEVNGRAAEAVRTQDARALKSCIDELKQMSKDLD
jgi:hypothetical protein